VTTLVALVAWAWLMLPRAAEQRPPFHGEVEVTRIVTEVRVIDHDGTPVLGLGPDDFRVSVDGTPAMVETADWRPAPSPRGHRQGAPPRPASRQEAVTPESGGRLIVLLYQIGLDFARIEGVYRIEDYASEFLRGLEPSDRVAIAVFTSHLRLHADFTNDFDVLGAELAVTSVIDHSTVEHDGREPSLARYFDFDRAERATNMRQALQIIGDALTPIPGPKSVVLLGWGVGEYRAGGTIWLGQPYIDALKALSDARATVFSLDISTADYHSLEGGLEKLSRDTGGFYMKTHLFPEIAVDKLARTLSGYYELSVIPPPDLAANFRVKVRAKVPGAEVHYRRVQFPDSRDTS